MSPFLPTERRIEEARLRTQRLVTYAILLYFTALLANVLMGEDQAERSSLLQTVTNLTMIAVGYWLGSSKNSMDKDATIGKMVGANGEVEKKL